jgi:hypothetical protein
MPGSQNKGSQKNKRLIALNRQEMCGTLRKNATAHLDKKKGQLSPSFLHKIT